MFQNPSYSEIGLFNLNSREEKSAHLEHAMETVELPVLEEEVDEVAPLDRAVDLAAFRLWQEASSLESGTPEETQNVEP